MNVRRRVRGSRSRRWARGILPVIAAVALVGAIQTVTERPAAAIIGNVIPMNENQDPTDTFTTSNALLAYVTTDPNGGRVCVVPESAKNDGTLSCDNAASWASPNYVNGIGSTIIPIQAPPLKVGTWRLLGDSPVGKPDALSFPFTVTNCDAATDDCDTSLANEVLSTWKDAAHQSENRMSSMCQLFDLAGELFHVKHARDVIQVFRTEVPKYGFVVIPYGGGIAFEVGEILMGATVEAGMKIAKRLTCLAEAMYGDIVDDPPDPDFGEIAIPVDTRFPELGDPLVDSLSVGLSDVIAQGEAMRISVERYHGALQADAADDVVAQLRAADQFGENLAEDMRQLAENLRAYGASVDANPDENDPVTTPAQLADTVALYERIQNEGFTEDELEQLTSAGLTPSEIQAVDDSFDIDMSTTPTNVSFNTVAQASADDLVEASDRFMEVALNAAAVAATLDAMDPSGPTAVDDVLTTVADTPGATDVLANDLGNPPLTVAASTDATNGTVACTPEGSCTYTPASGFTGDDAFTYTVADGNGATDIGSVAVTVRGDVASSPDAVDDSMTVTEGGSGSVDVLLNDTDPDGDVLMVEGFSQGAHGTVSCEPTGSCTYAPDGGFSGPDAFSYTATDGNGGFDNATVEVTVTAAPDRPTSCVVTALRSGPPAQQDVTAHDPDGIASILNVHIVNGTVAVPAFTSGTVDPVVLTATKADQTKRTSWEFDVVDSKGVLTHCV